jgi:hypothetical protein
VSGARGAGAAASSSRHLTVLAHEPRPAGGAAEARARQYAGLVLREAGFTVADEPFDYSALPGRWGTPIGGAIATATTLGAASVALTTGVRYAPAVIVVAGVTILAGWARAMLGDAVLDLPWLRARSVNLVATRGEARPVVWLVAHLDSKSQPVPSLLRVAGLIGTAAAMALGFACALLQLAAIPTRTGWEVAVALALAGGPFVMLAVVGSRSTGAVDNASGVAAVLEAATRLPPDVPCGVLLTSAEELGLAGARAWTRGWASRYPAGVALNCDGVDDTGASTLMYSGPLPAGLLADLDAVTQDPIRVRRMPFGLLTDSVALADRGWRTVTVSQGGLATLRRIHTSADSLGRLRGAGIDPTATFLARAVEALT